MISPSIWSFDIPASFNAKLAALTQSSVALRFGIIPTSVSAAPTMAILPRNEFTFVLGLFGCHFKFGLLNTDYGDARRKNVSALIFDKDVKLYGAIAYINRLYSATGGKDVANIRCLPI